MVLFTLITISLDASACIAWWAVKNTLYGTYCIGHYLIAGPTIIQKTKEEELIIELKTSVMHELAELNNKIINSHNMNSNMNPHNMNPHNMNPHIMNPHNMNPHIMNPQIINRQDIHFIETTPAILNVVNTANVPIHETVFEYIEIQNEINDDFVFIGRE